MMWGILGGVAREGSKRKTKERSSTRVGALKISASASAERDANFLVISG